MKLSPRALGYLASRYRSVLAKCRLLNTLGPLAMTCLLLAGGPGMAQASLQNPSAGVHDGLPQDYCTTLKVISSYGFRKAHEDSLSLTLEDPSSAQTAAVAGGGLARITNTGVAEIAVSESSVTVSFQDGILAGVLGGGIAEADQTAAGTAHMTIESSRATVNDGFIARIACGLVTGTVEYLEASVVGGGLAYGSQSSIRVGTTFVEINGGTVRDNTVAGSAALHGGTALVEGDTFLDLYDGETATLIGGNLLRNGTFENDATVTGSTNITMHGGTVRHNIFGGSNIVDASGSSTVQGDTSITIASTAAQTTSPISYLAGGGFVQNLSSASVASANVQGNTNITIEEGADVTVREIVGGGVGDVWTGGAATADVQGSTHITLEGGRAVLVFGGGSANNGSSSASSVSASVQTSCITIAGGSHGAVFGGGIAQSKGPGTARASVEDAHITVSGGSIMMLFAAGWADGTGASTAHDEGSTHAEVRMEGGSVEELWAGAYTSNGGQAGRLDVETHITGGTITGSLLAGNFTGDGPGKADPGSQVSIFLGGTASVQDGIVVSTDQTDIVLADSARVSTLNNTPVLDIAANQTQVTLRGNCVQIDGRFQAQGADNSLTFDQYQGTFSNSFSGFATLKAEAGSTVELDTLSTADNGQDLTLAGSGLFRANTVQATASHGLTVGNGLQGTTLIVTEGLASGDNITVADGARLSVSGTLTDEGTLSGIEGTVLVQAGGIYDVATQETALTGEALTALWDSLLKEGSDGLLILGNVVLTDLETAADGHILYNDVLDGVLAKNQYLQTADVADEFLDGEGVRGVFTSIHLTGNATALTVRETLVLAGESSNGFLAWYGTGEEARAADLHIGHISANDPDKHSAVVTLGLEEASNSGTLGHVCMDAGDGTATLNVLGDGSAAFTTSNIHTAEKSHTVINVRGALLQTGSLAASSAPLDELSVTSGAVRVQGDASLTNLTLNNGSLSSEADAGSSGSIRVGGTLSGQGFLAAEAELELKDYEGAKSDMLALRADTVTAGSLDSGQGGLAIEAQSLATGTCLLTGDSVIARDSGYPDPGGTLCCRCRQYGRCQCPWTGSCP